MSKGPDRVVGIYEHTRGGHEIKLVRNGKPISEYRHTREAAERRAAELRVELEDGARPASSPPLATREPEGASAGKARHERWLDLLWAGAERVAANPSDEGAQRALATLARAATAAQKLLHGHSAEADGGDVPDDRAFLEEVFANVPPMIQALPPDDREHIVKLAKDSLASLN